MKTHAVKTGRNGQIWNLKIESKFQIYTEVEPAKLADNLDLGCKHRIKDESDERA